jgi:hypothetical protein
MEVKAMNNILLQKVKQQKTAGCADGVRRVAPSGGVVRRRRQFSRGRRAERHGTQVQAKTSGDAKKHAADQARAGVERAVV